MRSDHASLLEPPRGSGFKTSIRILLIVAGAAVAVIASQIALYRFLPISMALDWDAWTANFVVEAAIAGGLVANLLWIVARPRQRFSRAAVIAVAANVVAWIGFLAVHPPLTPAQFAEIDAERTRRDRDSGIDLATHEPIIVAARMHYTYPPEGVADRLLALAAEPAITWAALHVVPYQYGTAYATRRESFTIAATAFVLSTAFWAVFPSAIGAVVRGWRAISSRARRTPIPERPPD
jgi:hypothetical protein